MQVHKNLVFYRTNIDYEATWKRLLEELDSNTGYPLASVNQTDKGHLKFRFKRSEIIFQISSKGTVFVSWEREDQKRILYPFMLRLLVPPPGEKLEIEPIFQQPIIPYPPPDGTNLYWCDERTPYIRLDGDRFKELILELAIYMENARTQ